MTPETITTGGAAAPPAQGGRRAAAALSALLGAAFTAGAAGAAAPPADCRSLQPAQAVRVMQDFFDAIRTNDEAGVRSLLTPDFHAFDGGRSLDVGGMAGLVRSAHQPGEKYQWLVTEPQVRGACGLASIFYVNRGSLTDAAGVHPLTWLESAVLTWDGGRWRIAFLESMRAADPAAPAPAASGS